MKLLDSFRANETSRIGESPRSSLDYQVSFHTFKSLFNLYMFVSTMQTTTTLKTKECTEFGLSVAGDSKENETQNDRSTTVV